MPRTLRAQHDSFPLSQPFRISRGVKTQAEVVTVELEQGGTIGRGEGVPYARYGESIESALAAIEQVRGAVEGGADRAQLLELLPPGAARNALDCALWDLKGRYLNQPIYRLLDHEVADLPTAPDDAHADAIGRRPPQHGLHPGQQFARLEGLGQVVVGAQLEPDHAVGRLAACGEGFAQGAQFGARMRRAQCVQRQEAIQRAATHREAPGGEVLAHRAVDVGPGGVPGPDLDGRPGGRRQRHRGALGEVQRDGQQVRYLVEDGRATEAAKAWLTAR